MSRIANRLKRLETRRGDGIPWCMCHGTIVSVTVDADDMLAGNEPETVCRRCGKALLLVIVVATGDAGRAQLAELELVK